MKSVLASLLLVGCQHTHQSFGVHPDVGASGGRTGDGGRFADVRLASLGAWAAKGQGTFFHGDGTTLELTLYGTLPGSYVVRLQPNCLGEVDAPAMCASTGTDFVSNLEVDAHGNAQLRVLLPQPPSQLPGRGLVLYRIVTDATQLPGRPSCAATACGIVEPVPAGP